MRNERERERGGGGGMKERGRLNRNFLIYRQWQWQAKRASWALKLHILYFDNSSLISIQNLTST